MTKLSMPRICPRCKGPMIPESDWYGQYSTCLYCGYVHEAVSTPPLEILEEELDGSQRQKRRQPAHYKSRISVLNVQEDS